MPLTHHSLAWLASALLPNRCPDMGHTARRQHGITGVERHPVVTDLDQERALERAEPLVLRVMQVARRAALRVEGVLEDEEAVTVLGGHVPARPVSLP